MRWASVSDAARWRFMGYAVTESDDFLALASLLRRHAHAQLDEQRYRLFLDTASALEARARAAGGGFVRAPDALHRPVNLTV